MAATVGRVFQVVSPESALSEIAEIAELVGGEAERAGAGVKVMDSPWMGDFGATFANARRRRSHGAIGHLGAFMTDLTLDIAAQPDSTTCGPTCLHAVYRHYRDDIELIDVIDQARALDTGGTLGALLGAHALKRGYRAVLYTYNLEVFDPTWFRLPRPEMKQRMKRRIETKSERCRLRVATQAYLEFLELGGEVRSADLSPRLVRRLLDDEGPVLTGLSATWLYGEAREIGSTNTPDDVLGEPAGHFVVLTGYDERSAKVSVADPLQPNALARDGLYAVSVSRLITAVLLGVLTYDANFLQIRPSASKRGEA